MSESAPAPAPVAALPYRPVSAILADLALPPAPAHVKTLADKNDARYVPWAYAQQYLSHYTNGYCQVDVVSLVEIADNLVATVKVTIWGLDENGSVISLSNSDVGATDKNKSSWGDPATTSVSGAFRRALARFGFCRNFWMK